MKIVLRAARAVCRFALCADCAALALLAASIDGEFFDFSKFLLIAIVIFGAGAFAWFAGKVFTSALNEVSK